MIRFWAAAKSLQIPVKARVLEAICLEQTWPLSLIRELSASIFLSVQELVLHMFLSLCLSVILSLALIIIARFCTPSSASFICHSSFPFSPSARLPLSSLSLSRSLPLGSEGKGELSDPAEGAEPADWGGPQGAHWNPRPFGPAWRRAPPQGRGVVQEQPAPVVTGAGNPGGMGLNIQSNGHNISLSLSISRSLYIYIAVHVVILIVP